jgi:hypothetical protein
MSDITRPYSGWIHPQAAAAAVTWLSLLTVKAIGAQVKPSRGPSSSGRAAAQSKQRACQPVLRAPGRVIAVEHRDFHNVPVPGDLGCGKIMSAGRTARLAGITGRGNRGSARTQLVDDPVDNELRSLIAASGKTRGERIVERRGSGGSVGTST